jgi:cellulose synthase operon protein C
MIIPSEIYQDVKRLNKRGLHLQAFRKLTSVCSLDEIEDIDSIILASGITHNLAAYGTSRKLVYRAFRKDPTNPSAIFYKAGEIFNRSGALRALMFIRDVDAKFSGDEQITSWWYSQRVELYSFLRDFKRADHWHRLARGVKPDEPWVWVTLANSLENQDRYQESLEASRQAFGFEPENRAAIFSLAHNLILFEKDAEALELLENASQKMENVWITKQLADLQSEMGMYQSAYDNYRRILGLMPIREEKIEEWLFASLSDAAYHNGEIAEAIEYAEKSKSGFHKKIRENLERSSETNVRKSLALGFVRQHEMTCAPATITNISRFWQKKAEHPEVADEMCYDGTPAYKERGWADRNGWTTREFKVNFETAKNLIDRGIPFTLTTIRPGNGHLQAAIGYDEKRKTLLIRDPYFRHIGEYEFSGLLEDQKSSGPRGLVLVPEEKTLLLEDLEFEESEQYDLLYRIDTALDDFDRTRAVAVLDEMKKLYPDHRLTWSAHWAVARFDSNNLALLSAVEKLLAMFPDDINLKLSYLSISDEFISRDEKLKLLLEYSRSGKTDPLLWQMLGYELSLDAAEYDRALRWLYKTLRWLPTNGANYRFIGDILWSRRSFEDAVELYRIAACLQDKDEQFAYAYFLAERHLDRTAEALEFLRDRYDRFGHLSDQPVRTLFHALRESGKIAEAFELLDEAVGKRPSDGDLKTFVAEVRARFGRREEAKSLLAETRERSSPRAWLQTAALIAEMEGNFDECLEYWRRIEELDPLSYDAHENIAQLLSISEGKEAAARYLQKVTRRFPHNRSLHRLRLSYLQDKNTEGIAVLRHLVRLNPRDAWSQRELSRWLSRVEKYEQALDAARTALQIDPNDPHNHWAYGLILDETGEQEKAAEAYKKSLELDVEGEYALYYWLDLCRTVEEKKAVLEFVREQLDIQKVFGNGIVVYQQYAKSIIKPAILLDQLKEIHLKHSDLRESYSAVIRQLVDMNRLDEALKYAEESTAKFPLSFDVWNDLSLVRRYQGEIEREIEALVKALRLFENWSVGIQNLADAHIRNGHPEEAKKLLEAAVRRLPLDQILYGYLAEVLWRLEEKNAAIEAVKRAVTLDSDYEWAWQMIRIWSEETGQTDLAAELAGELMSARPKDARTRLIYARTLQREEFSEEYHRAIESVLEIDPKNITALVMKADSLASADRFDDALAVTRTDLFDGYVPEQLLYAAAGIEAKRGNTAECVNILEKMTTSSPDYYPVWERLAAFYRNSEDHKIAHLRATRAMARLAPQDPIALGYHAEACLVNGKRDEAKSVLKQSITAAPEYEYGGLNLFDLYFEDKQFEQAEEVLEILKRHVNNDNSLLKEIRYAAHEDRPEQVENLFRKLCLSETAEDIHFEIFFENLDEFDLKRKRFVSEILEEIFSEPEANPSVGKFFIERHWDKFGESACLKKFEEFAGNRKVWSRAMAQFLEHIARERTPEFVRNFIERNRKELRSDTDAWGAAGYALHTIGEREAGINWFAGWEKRENVRPWMIWNYAMMLFETGEPEKALQIHRQALELVPDRVTNVHLLFVGLDEYQHRNFQAAWNYLIKVDTSDLSEWDAFFYQLLDLGILIREAAGAGRTNETEHLINRLINLGTSDYPVRQDKFMKKHFFESVGVALELSESSWLRITSKIRLFFFKFGL